MAYDIFDYDYFEDATESYDMIDAAFEAGYSQALIDAQEGTGTKRAVASAIGGPVVALIYRAIHKKHIKNAPVCSISKLTMNGLSSAEAKKEFAKTVQFLKSKHFVMGDNDFSNGVVTYNDLTPAGQKFINGFYDKLDEISEFDIEKAMRAKYSKSASNKQKPWDIANLVVYGLLAPSGYGIPGLIWSIVTLGKTNKDVSESEFFEQNMYK